MPSIQDVADQINARLDQVATHTADTATNTADMRNALIQANNHLGQIDTTLATGLVNLSQGLFTLIQVDLLAVELLEHHRKQNDTIICELAHANELLCKMMRELGEQLQLGQASLESVRRIEGIAERAHCCEAGDYDRHRTLLREVQACCPPEPVPPAPCPDACKVPIYREHPAGGQDWKPLPPPHQPNG